MLIVFPSMQPTRQKCYSKFKTAFHINENIIEYFIEQVTIPLRYGRNLFAIDFYDFCFEKCFSFHAKNPNGVTNVNRVLLSANGNNKH